MRTVEKSPQFHREKVEIINKDIVESKAKTLDIPQSKLYQTKASFKSFFSYHYLKLLFICYRNIDL